MPERCLENDLATCSSSTPAHKPANAIAFMDPGGDPALNPLRLTCSVRVHKPKAVIFSDQEAVGREMKVMHWVGAEEDLCRLRRFVRPAVETLRSSDPETAAVRL